jgi:type II secretory pathway component GspD/PulD (secretin)
MTAATRARHIITGLFLLSAFALLANLSSAQKPAHSLASAPAQDGLRFLRDGNKKSRELAHPAGGPKERIEVESTNDHIDYVTRTYVLKYANADEVWLFVANAIQKEGGFADRYAPGSNPVVNGDKLDQQFSGESLIVVTVPEWMISYLDETIKQLDRPGFKVGAYGNASIFIHPRHRRPSEIAEKLAGSSASGRQAYLADDSRNVLYLEDVPSYFAYALVALKEFDAPPDQIDLSVRIYEIDDQDGKDVGVDWYTYKKSASGGGFDFKWSNANNTSSYAPHLQGLTAELAFNPNLATEFLNFMTDKGKAKVITDTEITLVNGKPGVVDATTAVPYVIRGWIGGKVADQPNMDSPTATTPDNAIKEFTEGVTVNILPTIGTDSIQLDINAKVASQVGYTPNQNVPIISSSNVSSVIVLESGKAALLGGLKRKRNVSERQGLPGLRDLDGVKYLFSHEVSRERDSQIIITLRPTRVGTATAAQPREKDATAPHPNLGVANGTPQLETPGAPDEAQKK